MEPRANLCASGRVRVDGERAVDAAARVREGQAVEVDENAPRVRKGTLPREAILHLDRDVVVVVKPAGVLTVPYAAGDKDTLLDQAQAALRRLPRHPQKAPLGVVQRLDKDTTGLLVFARNLAAKRHLARQLRDREVTRRYLAIVNGSAAGATHDTMLVADRGDGLRGSWGRFRKHRGGPPREARRAITHVRVLERLAGATLIECRLETGRQHQIRIHLAEDGHPLAGEPVYIRDHAGALVDARRPMLHAETLGFTHPTTGERVELSLPPPEDFQELLERLREGPTARRR